MFDAVGAMYDTQFAPTAKQVECIDLYFILK